MSRYVHQLLAYGLGAVSFLTLGYAVDRRAQSLPFVSRVQSIAEPPHTHLFDQVTKGGEHIGQEGYCSTHTRLLIDSELALPSLKSYFKSHRVQAAQGPGMVAGQVHPIDEVKDLATRWEKYRHHKSLYIVDFVSPGSPESTAACHR